MVHPRVSTRCPGKERISVNRVQSHIECNSTSQDLFSRPQGKKKLLSSGKKRRQPPLSWPGFPKKESPIESLYVKTVLEGASSIRQDQGNREVRQAGKEEVPIPGGTSLSVLQLHQDAELVACSQGTSSRQASWSHCSLEYSLNRSNREAFTCWFYPYLVTLWFKFNS